MSEKTRVLIVDDDVNFAGTLGKILTKQGYEVTSTDSGFRALEIVKEKNIDVVLMDIKMPVMNGVDTYKKLKKIKPGMKVILMTAFSVDALIKDALNEGIYAVVHKPFDAGTIMKMIEKSNGGALIAVVDDDPNICSTMKNALEKKGYGVRTCSSGKECIELAKERKHNIFCLDMKMPVLNGLETYLEVKKINPNAVVVMMTAHRQEMGDLVNQVLKSGAYACLYKPFDMDEVIRIIDEISKKMLKVHQ